jgi:nucleotide-binding universal stress UspA family protein
MDPGMATPVLAAVDFSSTGRAAFEHALTHALSRDTGLVVIHAVPAGEPFRWHGQRRAELFDGLAAAADRAGVPLELRLQQGDPAGVILLHARAHRAQLIVLGTESRSRFERLRTRSVAERVARAATMPILVVPEASAAPERSVPSLRRIVAALDFSAASTRALDEALLLACAADGRVTMVHVLPESGSAGLAGPGHRVGVLEYSDRLLRQDAWQRLDGIIAGRPGVADRLTFAVPSGNRSKEIARLAQQIDADLIVVGVTARGAIGRRFFGATATRLMRSASCPVLAVPERAARAGMVLGERLAA